MAHREYAVRGPGSRDAERHRRATPNATGRGARSRYSGAAYACIQSVRTAFAEGQMREKR